MSKCKTKAIQADLEAYYQAHPGIIQAYSKTCVTLAYSISKTYSEIYDEMFCENS